MNLEFHEYEPKKILNVHKHVDGGWFWDKYSAHPYVGCRHGCEFCYTRGGHYLGKRDPETFDTLIQVKTNAPVLLRKEIARRPPDVISCGDWQLPAEEKYGLSRRMLEVVLEFGFPLLVIERSPFLLRDLDLLREINKRSWAGVALSFSNVDPVLKNAFEPHSPGLESRLQMMGKIAQAGILVGMSLMPILPVVGDDDAHLEAAVRAAKDHGASFVLAAGLTMDGAQAGRTLDAAKRLDPALEAPWRKMYGWAEGGTPNYGPPPAYSLRLARKVRELCDRNGLRDRIPRYTGAGPLAVNKQIAERLFLKIHDLELEPAAEQRIWTYRKAAWAVDECPESVAVIHASMGERGLRALSGIDPGIAKEIGEWLTPHP
ncbi:MAG: helix-hairpin-helix domain-containing protein [Anaerolineales bacterium]